MKPLKSKINPLFSVIIPLRQENDFLRETLEHLKQQKYQNFEVLVITDKISGVVSPAVKRNLGASMAKGAYLAFLDDDSYPNPNWLSDAAAIYSKHPEYSALCGPCLTPPSDNLFRQASGLVWSSYLGSGGAGTYRNSIASARFVDDYPSVNLIVKKIDFDLVNGFDTHHWPGEDTILCLNLRKLDKLIYYHPKLVVYHHRRNVLIPHLRQITRYALHRGLFAKIYPSTSRRLGYFIPSLFFIYTVILALSIVFKSTVFKNLNLALVALPLFIYIILLLLTLISFIIKKQNVFASILAVITIPFTHLYYGFLFIKGFFLPSLSFEPHKVNPKTGSYVGG